MKRAQGAHQVRAAEQDLPGLRFALLLAQKMGTRLGERALLLRAVSAKREKEPGLSFSGSGLFFERAFCQIEKFTTVDSPASGIPSVIAGKRRLGCFMSNATRATACVLGLSLLMLLSGCGLTLPPKISIMVTNYYEDLEGTEPEFACSEGIKVRLTTGSLKYENTFTRYGDGNRIFFPEDVRAGTLATLDVWCLDNSENEPGYIKISKSLRPSSVGYLHISMVSKPSNREGCVPGMVERSPTPCVESNVL